jgi:transglutaminase-like putative cysteine protease
MLIAIEHVTRYRYDKPVRGVVQSHRLTPAAFEGQRVLSWDVAVTDGLKGGGFRDGAGDWVQGWSVTGPVAEIAVTVRGLIETADMAGVLRGHREVVPPMAYLAETVPTRADAALTAMAEAAAGAGTALSIAHAMAGAVAEAIVWTPDVTVAQTTAAEALAQGKGVCQDHAHALIAVARAGGVPARYVTGYLLTGEGVSGEAAHAWAELWVDGLGWVGFDAANACCPDDRYVRLGSGCDAAEAAPIRGTARSPGAERMDVSVQVTQAQGQSQQ